MNLPLRAQEWPPFIRRLKDHGYHVKSMSADGEVLRFSIDLSEWQLCFSDDTPLLYLATLPDDDGEAAEFVRDVVRANSVRQDSFVIVNRNTPELKRELGRSLFPRIIVCDAADQQNILSQHSVTHALRNVITSQFKLIDLVPYHIGGRGSRFFGRHEEMNRILRHDEADFSITGIRRVGKTFLLNECRRLFVQSHPGEPPPLIFDCSGFREPHDFIRAIVRDTDIRIYNRRENVGWSTFDGVKFLKQLAKSRGGRVVLFLDECDQLLKLAHESPDLLNVIRGSINTANCRYVMAGFQQLMQEIGNDKSPLYLEFEIVRLQPFRRDETREMVLPPFQGLGVHFEDAERILNQLHDDTGGMPLVLQYYCEELTKIVQQRGDNTIRIADVGSIHAEENLKSIVLDSFRESASKEDQLLVYIVLERYGPERVKGGFTQQEIYEALDARGWPLDLADVDRACDRLVLAGFLMRQDHQFRFRIPAFVTLVFRHHNLHFTVDALKKELRKR